MLDPGSAAVELSAGARPMAAVPLADGTGLWHGVANPTPPATGIKGVAKSVPTSLHSGGRKIPR